MADGDYLETVRGAAGAILMIAIIVVVANFLVPFAASDIAGSTAFEPSTSTYEDVSGNERPDALDVAATRERAVSLPGDGSYVATQDPQLTESWTVCSVGALASGYNTNATYDLLAIDNESITLRYHDGNWTARYINASDVETAASAAASSPTDQTAVCGRWNHTATELDLVVDGSVQATSQRGDEDHNRSVSVAWEGTIDETRAWNRTLTNGELSDYASDPIQVISGDRELRVMYDEDIGGGTRAHYVGGAASFVGDVSLVSGVQRPGIQEGTDWEDRESGTYEIRAVSGGYLDGAPIVFVSWQGAEISGLLAMLTSVGSSALILLVIGVFAMAYRVVADELGGF